MPRPLRVLVTGGLGYVGGWISARMAAAGHELFVLSSRPRAQQQAFAYTHVTADLATADSSELAALLPDTLDAVIHAASLNEAFAPEYARRALLINALGTRTLLEALAKKSEKNSASSAMPLVIYCSTFHVYGASSGHITENSPAQPVGDYALTHYFAEEYCRAAMRASGPPCIIVRLTNGYGAAKTPVHSKWHLLINDLCRAAAQSGTIVLRSNPAVRRDFVWLGDMAETCEALAHRRDLAGRLFNVASGHSFGIGEIADRIAAVAEKVLGHAVPVVREFQETHSQVSDFKHALATGQLLHVDNTALQKALGLCFHDKLDEEAAAILAFLQKQIGASEGV